MLSHLMARNPRATADQPILTEMAKIGIVPGKAFDQGKLPQAAGAALQGVPKEAQGKILAHRKNGGETYENGWLVMTRTGVYGTDYMQRAFIALVGLGANRPEDAIYPVSEADVNNVPYDGSHKYVLHFAKGETPPVKGFWSLTMYNGKLFFVANSLKRSAVSSRTPFTTNRDGSTDIYLQTDSPGPDKEVNLLPSPPGKFVLMLRLYWPNDEPPTILDGSWKPPAVTRAD
jgi:hypothetical protein